MDITLHYTAHGSGPTLVIAGTRDMVREDHTRLIAQSLPNVRRTSTGQ